MNKVTVKKYQLNGLDEEVAQAFTKFMIEATTICGSVYYRVKATIRNDGNIIYDLDFSSGDVISDAEMDKKVVLGEKLEVMFYELATTNELPEVKQNTLEVICVVKEQDEVRNCAVETSMYRLFANKFFKALELFPTRFFKDVYYINGMELF